MAKKNKDLIPFLIIGGAGLFLLSGKKKTASSTTPQAPTDPTGGGTSGGGTSGGGTSGGGTSGGGTSGGGTSGGGTSGGGTSGGVTVKIKTDADTSPFWGVHDHLGTMSKQDDLAETYMKIDGYKNGLRESDIAAMVVNYRNGKYDDLTKYPPYNYGAGYIYTGERNQLRGTKSTLNHYHYGSLNLLLIKKLSEDGIIKVGTGVGQELPPESGTESHYHDIIIELS